MSECAPSPEELGQMLVEYGWAFNTQTRRFEIKCGPPIWSSYILCAITIEQIAQVLAGNNPYIINNIKFFGRRNRDN